MRIAVSAHADLIARFRGGLGSGALPPGVTARDPAEAERRFAVYRNNVAHSLSQALARRFAVIERLVGAEFFKPLAAAFIAEHPPASPMLFRWGVEFADFLASFPPLAELPYLADVARLEWLRGEAYHAADARPADAGALARAAEAPALALAQLHPSVRLLKSRFAAVTIWQANQPDAVPVEIDASQPEYAAILRDPQDQVQVLPLSVGDMTFLAALERGYTLLTAAEAAQTPEPQHEAGRVLLTLAHAGAFIAFPQEVAL